MCDYSLNHYPNRLAREGEKLVTHRFSSGCVGLVAADSPEAQRRPSRWLFGWLNPLREAVEGAADCAVCVPPGARLKTADGQIVTFTQLSAEENAYRDAVIFPGGRGTFLLHQLNVGFEFEVLCLDPAADPSRAKSIDAGAMTGQPWRR